MKINFSEKMIGFDGTKIYNDGKQARTDDGKRMFLEDGITPVIIPSEEVATLADICKKALLRLLQTDRELCGEKKFEYAQLAERTYKGGVCEVTAEEITLLKERIGLMFEPMIVGICYKIFESAKTDEVKKDEVKKDEDKESE